MPTTYLAGVSIPLSQAQTQQVLSTLACSKERKSGAPTFSVAAAGNTQPTCTLTDIVDQIPSPCQCHANDHGLYITVNHGSPLHIELTALFIQQMLKHFSLSEPVQLSCAVINTEGGNIAPGCGGKAAFITPRTIQWVTTFDWLEECMNQWQANHKQA